MARGVAADALGEERRVGEGEERRALAASALVSTTGERSAAPSKRESEREKIARSAFTRIPQATAVSCAASCSSATVAGATTERAAIHDGDVGQVGGRSVVEHLEVDEGGEIGAEWRGMESVATIESEGGVARPRGAATLPPPG